MRSLSLLLAVAGLFFAQPSHAAAKARATGGGSLPDSLLARVGDHRQISLADFRLAWSQVSPPQRPDSLTPLTARKFLDLLVGKEVLGTTALQTPWVWTARESAEYLGLSDHLVMGVMLDSALTVTYLRQAAKGDTIRNLNDLGTLTRDSTVAALGVTFDTTLTRRLAAVWAAIPKPSRESTFMAQLRVLGAMPNVAPADTGRVLARSSDGDFRVSELVASWARLDPLQRPRVSTPVHIEDITRNALFERLLRRQAIARGVAQRPDIAAALEQRYEYNAVSHLVQHEIYDSLHASTDELRAYFDAHREDFALPLRVRVVRLDLPTRDAGSRMALQLRDPVEAESLAARGKRSGADYEMELSAESDSAAFTRAIDAGVGAVIGPDSSHAGWTVARVMTVIPARLRVFEEAAPLVEHAWYAAEGEQRMIELLDRLRKNYRVAINDKALKTLVAVGIPKAKPPAR
jgi:PPIC-type PPIASE domain